VDRNDSVSGVGYRAAAAGYGWPSMATVTARFGGWTRALRAAGLTVDAGRCRPKMWTNDQLAEVVTEYFTKADKWSSQGLDLWLRTRQGGPSLSLVRKRLGPWPALTKLAVENALRGQ
jgi:hypothetical protein